MQFSVISRTLVKEYNLSAEVQSAFSTDSVDGMVIIYLAAQKIMSDFLINFCSWINEFKRYFNQYISAFD